MPARMHEIKERRETEKTAEEKSKACLLSSLLLRILDIKEGKCQKFKIINSM